MGNPIQKEVVIGDCRLLLGDSLSIMPALGKVDAVVTDPPYGIKADENPVRGSQKHEKKGWDRLRPDKQCFSLMMQVSSEQIIWGGNYFTDYLPPTMRWLIWDKGQRNFSLADCEVAWTSQNKAMRIFDYTRAKAQQDGKQHPTQKPIALMEWCLGFLPDAETILDPFAGSGSTGVACVNLGRKFIGIEKDPGYFQSMCDRIAEAHRQADLFVAKPEPKKPEQTGFDL